MNTIEQLPEIVEKHNLSPIEKKLERIRNKIIELVDDSTQVIHAAIKGETWNGKKITRTQLYAASPIVQRFAPTLEQSGSGQVHLHLNIPRPKAIEVIEAIETKDSAPKETKQG